jgi:hypothetical protein
MGQAKIEGKDVEKTSEIIEIEHSKARHMAFLLKTNSLLCALSGKFFE